jgi:hypothetical protein
VTIKDRQSSASSARIIQTALDYHTYLRSLLKSPHLHLRFQMVCFLRITHKDSQSTSVSYATCHTSHLFQIFDLKVLRIFGEAITSSSYIPYICTLFSDTLFYFLPLIRDTDIQAHI